MPPKSKQKKAGKGKASTAAAGLSAEELSKDELEELIVRLREELDREREERSFFQLERDKIHSSWEISKRKLEEVEAKLRNRSRERDEAEERHQVEITIYKQKLKHVLSEQLNTVSEMKLDAVSSASLIQNQNTESELGRRRDVQKLQADSREKFFSEESSIKELKLKHQVELMKLSEDYSRRLREVEVKHHQRMESVVEVEEKKRRSALGELENQMKSRVASLMEENDRELRRAEEFYCQVQSKQQEELKVLKEELGKQQNQVTRLDKELSAAQQENKDLKETMQEAQQKLPELQRRLQDHDRVKDSMMRHHAQLKVVEQDLRDLTLEHELLCQAFQKIQQERDELLRQQTESILDLQQRSGLKKMLLEKKLAALTETVEKKEVQLCAALSVSGIDPTTRCSASNRLEETLESKRVRIESLQENLDRESEEFNQLQESPEDLLIRS